LLVVLEPGLKDLTSQNDIIRFDRKKRVARRDQDVYSLARIKHGPGADLIQGGINHETGRLFKYMPRL
jgi:hypothetical protein